jgi:hypothetical protein
VAHLAEWIQAHEFDGEAIMWGLLWTAVNIALIVFIVAIASAA